MTGQISFTPEKVKALRRAYNKAVKDGAEQFIFEGHDILTAYAKYLLEYLEARLKEP